MRAIILALAVLALTAVTVDAQQTPNARVFSGGAGLILYTIKPGSTADFETVLNKTKEALRRARSPSASNRLRRGACINRIRRQQTATSPT